MLCVSGLCSYPVMCHVQLLSDRYPYLGTRKKPAELHGFNSWCIYIVSLPWKSSWEVFGLREKVLDLVIAWSASFIAWILFEFFLCALRITGSGGRLCKKVKAVVLVLQHCCLEAYCTLTQMSSFIHLQRRCTHQAAWETSASEGRNDTWNLASNP